MSIRAFLSVACIVTYWLIGHGFADFYPISPLGMFRDRLTSSSRLVVRPVGGDPIEVSYYVDWHCDGPLDFSNEAHPACPQAPFSAYDSIVTDYILAHRGPSDAGVPVEIVRRQYTIADRSIEVSDCVLLSCTARRQEPTRWRPRL